MENKSRICLALTSSTSAGNLRNLEAYRADIDLAELRVDFLSIEEQKALGGLDAGVPVILTCRRAQDGGQFQGSESDRAALLLQILEKACDEGLPYAFLDLEEDVTSSALEVAAQKQGVRIIRSLHDPDGVPENLEERLLAMRHNPQDLPKAAVTPSCTADVLGLFQLAARLPFEKILIGMGDYGFPTRILTARMGSYLTFTSAVGTTAAAPGHLDPATLTSLYRFRKVTEETHLFGIIGNPVMHSFSPHIHNRGYDILDLDALYVPFLVDRVEDFVRLADFIGLRGVSVTIPHKKAVIQHASTVDLSVDAVGACNTLVRKSGGWFGTNTDVPGFLAPLAAVERSGRRRAAVIGAGGVARAIVYALKTDGWNVLVLNRTPQKARELAQEFDCEWGPLDQEGLTRLQDHRDLIAQATAAGMEPWQDLDPLVGFELSGREIIYDTVFNPPETRLAKRAAQAGCTVIRGGRMLIAQAEHQFRLFTGRDYPDPESVDIGAG